MVKKTKKLMTSQRIQNETSPILPSETEIRVRVEHEITDKERLIIDELKDLMMRKEIEE